MEDADHYHTRYRRDGHGNVIHMNDGDGEDWIAMRDALGRLTRAVDPSGAAVNMTYTPNGQVETRSNPRDAGLITRFTYDAEDRLLTTTDAVGHTLERSAAVVSYDGMGRVLEFRDYRGSTTSVEYDANGLPWKTTDALGQSSYVRYTQSGLTIEAQDRRGSVVRFTHDELDRLRRVDFPESLYATMEYNHVGVMTELRDRRGYTSTLGLDELYRTTSVTRAGVTLASMQYTDASRLSRLEDRYGSVSTWEYNDRHLPRLATGPDGRETTTQYDGVGRAVQVTAPGGVTTIAYNDQQRTQTVTFGGETTTMRRNAAGLLAELTRPEQQAGGLHAGQTRTYQYDALDRLSSVTEGGLTTRYAYDAGDLLRHTYDPEDRHTETTYDVLGRATAMIQHMAEGEPALVTAYENYDGEGNARLVRDPLGQETTLTYDGLGRLTDVTLPAPLGEVAAGLPRLLSTHAAYDGGDCVTAVTETLEPDGGGAAFTRELTWDHDAFGRMTRHGQRGRDVTYTYNDSLRQMAQASSGGTTLYQYDALGRIDWAELDGDRVDVSYVEHEDLVSTVTNPNGTVATFGYDAATRRLTGVTHTRGGTPFLAYGYAYDHNGNRTLETVTEGGSEERNEYTYDALDRMTLHRRETGATPGPEDIRETRYAFELSGARGYNRRVEDVQDGGGQELARRVYDYDGANRLTTLSETGGATRTVTYAHDANGNRLSRVDSAAGGEQTLYRYTVQNQLSEVLAGPAGAEVSQGQYEYDALGRRVRQHGTQRGDIETVYDGLSTLDEHEVSGGGAGTPLGHYHYALGLARLDEGGGEERYYHLDGRGNTGALTAGSGGADTPGDVLTSYRLDPFGAVRSGSDPVNRQVYTGHETDTETGLIYMNARHYDPETGRFVTQDTWLGSGGSPATQNRYAYALGNPATYWDPTGHWTEVYPGGCTSGKDKCEQAAGGQGGIPYPEDSSVIPLGGPSPSSAAPAPQTQATRPPPPAPRGTYSVISGGAMPAQAYNAIYSSVRSGRRVDEHTEVTAGNDGDATSANPNALENMMSDLQAWRGHRAEAAAARRAQAEALDVPMADPAFLQNRLLRTNLGIEQGANAIIDMAGGVADLAGHTFLGGSYLGAGAMTAAGGALAFILGDSQAAEVNVGRAQGFFADAGEHAYAIIEAYLGFCAGNIQHLITDPLGATMPMSPMVQMRRALSLSLGDFDAWANVTTEGLMALGGVVLGKTLSALGRIGRGVGVTVEAAPGASVASTSGSGATTPSPGSTPTPPLLLTTGNPTTLTLRQVRNLRGKSLWQGGEQYVQELYGSAGQQHFSVPAQGAGVSGGGRFVDAPVVGTNGVLGLEVKTYLRWRTVHGAPQRGAVPLSPEIQEQVLRDAWLQTHHPGGFDPRWVFIDAPPSQALADFLTAHNVAYIVYQ